MHVRIQNKADLTGGCSHGCVTTPGRKELLWGLSGALRPKPWRVGELQTLLPAYPWAVLAWHRFGLCGSRALVAGLNLVLHPRSRWGFHTPWAFSGSLSALPGFKPSKGEEEECGCRQCDVQLKDVWGDTKIKPPDPVLVTPHPSAALTGSGLDFFLVFWGFFSPGLGLLGSAGFLPLRLVSLISAQPVVTQLSRCMLNHLGLSPPCVI